MSLRNLGSCDGVKFLEEMLTPGTKTALGISNSFNGLGIDIRKFGVRESTSNPTFDNSSAWESAISSGEPLFVPKGTWLTSTSISLLNNTRISGIAGYSIIKLADNSNCYTIYANNKSECTISGIVVDGNRVNQAASDNHSGIYFLDCVDSTFIDTWVHDARGDGFFMSGEQYTGIGHRYFFCRAYNNGKAGGPAYTGFSGHGDNAHFFSCESFGNIGGGFKQMGRHVTFHGCYSHDNGVNGFSDDFTTDPESWIQGQYFHFGSKSANNAGAGFYLSRTSREVELHGIISENNSQSGVYVLNNVDLLKIFGGDIRNNGQGGSASDYYRAGISLRETIPGSVTNISINGTSITDNQTPKTQKFGIYSESDIVSLNISPSTMIANNANGAAIVGGTVLQNVVAGSQYLSGMYYSTWPYGAAATGTVVPAADTLYLYPFQVTAPMRLKTIHARINTGGAGSSMKCGIYENSAISNRPVGAPIYADNTGVATTSSTTNTISPASGSIGITLLPGLYWMASKFTGTLPSMFSIAVNSGATSFIAGHPNSSGFVASGISIASTYSNDLPTLAEGASFNTVTTSGLPIFTIGIT